MGIKPQDSLHSTFVRELESLNHSRIKKEPVIFQKSFQIQLPLATEGGGGGGDVAHYFPRLLASLQTSNISNSCSDNKVRWRLITNLINVLPLFSAFPQRVPFFQSNRMFWICEYHLLRSGKWRFSSDFCVANEGSNPCFCTVGYARVLRSLQHIPRGGGFADLVWIVEIPRSFEEVQCKLNQDIRSAKISDKEKIGFFRGLDDTCLTFHEKRESLGKTELRSAYC